MRLRSPTPPDPASRTRWTSFSAILCAFAVILLGAGLPVAADEGESEEFIVETCGPATHPAVLVAVIPGAGASWIIVHQFPGAEEGSVYVSWFMQSHESSVAWNYHSIAFAGYEHGKDYQTGGGGKTNSGQCRFMGSMPTSPWYFDTLGGGGGWAGTEHCETEVWWEWQAGGSAELGSGFEVSGHAQRNWGEAHICGESTTMDSSYVLQPESTLIDGICIPCLTQLEEIMGMKVTMPSATPVIPEIGGWDYGTCWTPHVPVTEKMLATDGSLWQLGQVYDPLDDTTPLLVLYENAPITRDLFFGTYTVNMNSPQKNWHTIEHHAGPAIGCRAEHNYGDYPVFGYFHYGAAAATGDGDCHFATRIDDSSNLNDASLVVRLYNPANGSETEDIAFGDDGDCIVDTYETTLTLAKTGTAAIGPVLGPLQ